ncbi:metalloreductase Fre8 [Exophiala viscosa]|uniref:metalloreductase Fre8 n=1 Tax=Exophiala viscosa TaxID=2486360 RepID=UPI00219B9495|nr:metalloreductase Fre8 [Exophiala viscosa]
MAYSFVTLTSAEKDERRRQLNLSGEMAWVSPIIILLGVYIHRKLLRPLLSQTLPPHLLVQWRRVSWVLGTKTSIGGTGDFGPLGVQLFGALYLIWLLVLIFRSTGQDYMHLAKAFGHVAVSQLPLNYLLGMKSMWSPVSLATGLSHERLNSWHRLFGRILYALVGAHVLMYLNFFVQQNLLAKRIGDWDVLWGVVAFVAFSLLWVLSLPGIRRRWYHFVFYRSHVVLSAVVVLALWWHVPYTRVYVGLAGLVWGAGAVVRRFGASVVVNAQCEAVEGTELVNVLLEVPRESALATGGPGQHLYLHAEGFGPRTPFTIAAVEYQKKGLVSVRLVVRNVGGPQTRSIADIAKSREVKELRVEGPYGGSGMSLPEMVQRRESGPVLMVAGGVGATYIIPIYIALVEQRRSTAGKDAMVRMIWVVRRFADASWGIEMLKGIGAELEECGVDVYVTRGSVGFDVEMEEQRSPELTKHGVSVHKLGRRPDLEPMIEGFFPVSAGGSRVMPSSDPRLYALGEARRRQMALEEATVFVCGPGSLANDVREVVGRQVMEEGRKVKLIEEVFGFGGT